MARCKSAGSRLTLAVTRFAGADSAILAHRSRLVVGGRKVVVRL